MPDPVTTLAGWVSAFRRIDECPWAGPRPLERNRAADMDLLKGRTDDKVNFTEDVLGHSLVVLTGDSGVGKSSLLNVGLVPGLQADGFTPLVCSDWTRSEGAIEDPEAFVATKLRGQLPPDIRVDRPGSESLCTQLDNLFGETAVLILDQFEELIRYQPVLFHRTLEWVSEVNRSHSTHVVISLRAEYAHRLRELVARPFTMATYVLEAVNEKEEIGKIISSGNTGDKDAISSMAASEVLSAWQGAQDRGGPEWAEVGLLHLQAVLYALHARAGGGRVEVDHVTDLKAAAAKSIFERGLREAVWLKLDRCSLACDDPSLPRPIDPVLVHGTREMVQRVIPHLSSGGYKLVREEWDLATNTLDIELARLGRPVEEQEKIFRRLSGLASAGPESAIGEDLLTVTGDMVEGTDGEERSAESGYLAEFGVDPAPWVTDPADRSSGPMLGMAPQAILIEELRRFVFALQWLRTASLIRTSTPAIGQTMVSLIHDGFGPALEAWGREHSTGPAPALNLLTAAHGQSYTWQVDRSDMPAWGEFDGGDDHVTIANVRWRDCQVSATFRRVVFVNCDLRGTRFEHCGFRGVVYINCLLDGASFGECSIYGSVEPAAGDQAVVPSFRVDVAQDMIRVLDHYRRTDSEKVAALFSITSGVPAVPWRENDGLGLPWKAQDGGLTMYGGRLSSLMIRDCTFHDGGMLAFRHIAGSSLDIVEQTGGHLDIFDSAIRGLTVTGPVHATEPSEPEDEQSGHRFDVHVEASLLADTWFGDRLVGEVRCMNSVLWQLLNLSDRKHLEVTINECGYHGLVNVSLPVKSTEQQEFGLLEIQERTATARMALRMDYRIIPARLELEGLLLERRSSSVADGRDGDVRINGTDSRPTP